MTVQKLLQTLLYNIPSEQDIDVLVRNGDNLARLEEVHLLKKGSKLTFELRAPANGKARQVIRTITDRSEIARITKASSHRNGYQVRNP